MKEAKSEGRWKKWWWDTKVKATINEKYAPTNGKERNSERHINYVNKPRT